MDRIQAQACYGTQDVRVKALRELLMVANAISTEFATFDRICSLTERHLNETLDLFCRLAFRGDA